MKSKTTRLGARSLLLALSCLATAAFAQDASQKVVQELDALEPGSAINAPQQAAVPVQIRTFAQSAGQRASPRVLALPALASAKAALAAPAPGQPLQIGLSRNLPDATNAAATAGLLSWTQVAGGSQRAALSVRVPGAKGLRLGLLVEQLPPGALLRVYAPDSAQTTEITAAEVLRTIQTNVSAGDNSAAAHTYWLPTVQGAEAALEIELPAGVSPSQLKVSLPTVSHLVMLPTDTEAQVLASGSCNIDVMCTSNQTEMNSVAKMIFTVPGEGSYACSGTLLGNSRNDRTPYFLSANHCISTQTAASSLQTIWNYRSSSCGSGQVGSGMQTVSGGATLLYQTSNTDTSFMRLNGTPPSSATFAGWSATPGALNAGIFGIHHPAGDLQKYSEGTIKEFATCGESSSDGNFSCTFSSTLDNNTYYNAIFSRGTVEGGSSGSALFTSSGRQVIGQLRGGNHPGCPATPNVGDRYYGRFDLAYNAALKTWLSPTATTYTVTASVNGTGGTISPSGSITGVTSGSTRTFTLAPSANYQVSSVGGTCGGTRNGNSYTTSPIESNCTVVASFAPVQTQTYTVTASVNGTGGTISPSGQFSVPSGTRQTFTVTPNTGYGINSVSGCGGTLSGNTYTTAAITGSCTVTATFISSGRQDDCSESLATNCIWANLANPINGAIETVGDRDVFRFTPTVSGLWRFTASKPASNPLLQSAGALYNSAGALLAYDASYANNYQFRVQANLRAGQTYYLQVYTVYAYTGNYTVTATRQ